MGNKITNISESNILCVISESKVNNIHSGYEKLLQNSVLTSTWFASKSHTQILGTENYQECVHYH